MEFSQLNWVANFIRGIADDELRDLYVRGKYRDVILPMTVIRRLDTLREPTKKAVLDPKAIKNKRVLETVDRLIELVKTAQNLASLREAEMSCATSQRAQR